MSHDSVPRIRREATDLLVDATWRQWSDLIPAVVPRPRDRGTLTLIDPEALILGSLAAADHERRLADAVASWARGAPGLTSLQRMRQLGRRFPTRVHGRLSAFARDAVEGGDRRWKSLIDDHEPNRARAKDLGEIRILEGPALTLRLRSGFGVNAKADLLSFLLGLGGEAADLKTIAQVTAYSERTIRNAADEMTLAGFIHEIEGRPSSFYSRPERWTKLLSSSRADAHDEVIPQWRPWGAAFAFLSSVIEWAGEAQAQGWTPYVASSRARDLYEEHRTRLSLGRVGRDAPPEGDSGPTALQYLIERIGEWR